MHKVFKFYVVKVEYTVLCTIDRKNRRVDFQLDPEYKHDLEDTAGYFLFEPVDDKTTLFTYAATNMPPPRSRPASRYRFPCRTTSPPATCRTWSRT